MAVCPSRFGVLNVRLIKGRVHELNLVDRESLKKIDKHIGSNVKSSRQFEGLSQQELGDGIGVSCQQVQKYESGANRIGGSRLFHISRFLGVPVSQFFVGLDCNKYIPSHQCLSPSAVRLAQSIDQIPNKLLKKHLVDLIQLMKDGEFHGK